MVLSSEESYLPKAVQHAILLRINNVSPDSITSSHKRKGNSNSEAKSTSVLGESWDLPQNELIILYGLWELPQRRCSQRSKGTVSCCCSARLVTYWARNAPTKLGQRETVLHKRSSGGSRYCKLVPSTTKWYISNTHAAFHNFYIGKGDWWFSEAVILLPLTYFEVQKILFGYHDNTPPKELNPATP